jgi:MFS family permease
MPSITGNKAFAALRFPQFRMFITGNMLQTMALLIQEVLLGYELYKMTENPLVLGMVGLAEALPYMALALYGGYIADKLQKIRIMKVSQFIIILLSAAVYALFYFKTSMAQGNFILLSYAIICCIGIARGFYHPAASAIKAYLIPRQHYSNAASWSSSFWQIGAVLGPGLAGFLYSGMGMGNTLLLVMALMFVNLLLLTQIPDTKVQFDPSQNILQSIREGFAFVFGNKILFYSITLDLVAVLFGGVVAILPVFAEDILHVGPKGLGILRAAPSAGAIITIIGTAFVSPTHKAWRNMIVAVTGFGLATLAFALSRNFYLSAAMLFLTGAFDSISVVIRQTILQVVPPDHIRGRVVAVNSLFVSSSNEVGAFESGLAAKLMGTVPSVVAGAGLTLIIIFMVMLNSKELLHLKLEQPKT